MSRKQQICGKKQAQRLPEKAAGLEGEQRVSEKAAGLERKRGSEETVDLGKKTQKERRTTTTKFPKKQSFHTKIDKNQTGKSLFATTHRSGFIFNYRPNPAWLVAFPGHPTGREIKANKGELANNKIFAMCSREAMSLFLIYLCFSPCYCIFPQRYPNGLAAGRGFTAPFHGRSALGGCPPRERLRVSQWVPLDHGRVQRVRPGRPGRRQRHPGVGFHPLLRRRVFSVSIAPKTLPLRHLPALKISNFKHNLHELSNLPGLENLGLTGDGAGGTAPKPCLLLYCYYSNWQLKYHT